MKFSYLVYWFPRVIVALAKNKGTHRASNLTQLAFDIARHDKQLRKELSRIRKVVVEEDAEGEVPIPDTIKRHCYAAALGVPESELSPDSPRLIAGAAVFLVRHHLGRTIGEREAQAYGGYLATGPPAYEARPDDAARLDPESLRRVLRDMPGVWKSERELERAILGVAAAVGEVLSRERFNGLIERAPLRSKSRRGGM